MLLVCSTARLLVVGGCLQLYDASLEEYLGSLVEGAAGPLQN